MNREILFDETIEQSEVDEALDFYRQVLDNEINKDFNLYLSSEDYKNVQLKKPQEKQLLDLLDKYQFKGSLKSTILYYCSRLIPMFDKDCQELKEVSMDDLNAQRKYWDNMIENLQVRMNNASSNAKERLRSMIKAAIIQKGKLKVLKGTKQKPINTYMKPIAFHLRWLADYKRANIVDFIYDLYYTFEYEDYGKRHEDDFIFNKLSKKEKKKEQIGIKREAKRWIYDWYRSTFDELELP